VVEELISPEIVHHVPRPAPGPGPEGVKQFIRATRQAIAHLHVTTDRFLEIATG